MHQTIHRATRGELIYYSCDRLPVPHAFTTKFGGVSAGACESLNLGFGRGDDERNVRENWSSLCAALGLCATRVTLTHQVHEDQVSVVTEQNAGTGLYSPMSWQSDALITACADTPLAGFYADCVVTLLYDPATHTAGVCHSGWRGTSMGILPKTVDEMARSLGTRRDSLIAVMGPSICRDCFETDADVPDAMERQLGPQVHPFVTQKDAKFHVDLRGLNAVLLQSAGLLSENIIDSGLCTMCEHQTFWSHRKTDGVRGVQAGVICLPSRRITP